MEGLGKTLGPSPAWAGPEAFVSDRPAFFFFCSHGGPGRHKQFGEPDWDVQQCKSVWDARSL